MDLGIVSTTLDASGDLVIEQPKAATSTPDVETNPKTSAVEEKAEAEDTSANEAEVAEDLDSDNESDEDSDEPKAEDDEPAPKKKSGFEKRIEKLNKKATAAEKRAVELEARLAAIEKPATAAPAAPSDADLNGIAKPRAEDFDTNADYVEALFDFAAKKSAAQAQAEQAKAEHAAATQKATERFSEATKLGAEKYDDFEDAIDLSDFDMKPTAVFSAFLNDINDTALRAELMYHLGSNRDEFRAILKLSEIGAIKALTKLEDKLSKPSPADTSEVKVTKAPKPPTVVSGARSSKVSKITDDMTYDEFKRVREAQLKSKR